MIFCVPTNTRPSFLEHLIIQESIIVFIAKEYIVLLIIHTFKRALAKSNTIFCVPSKLLTFQQPQHFCLHADIKLSEQSVFLVPQLHDLQFLEPFTTSLFLQGIFFI